MIVINVYKKSTNELWWTEEYDSSRVACQEVKHMKENHFKPEYFDIKVGFSEDFLK